MNFLAHLYLSGNSDGVKIGNFIGDHVKGNKFLSYTEEVRKGILLHRQIDTFTDRHVLVNECSALLRPVYRKYSGVIVDMYFDHFLANLWVNYSDVQLNDFTRHAHAILLKNFFILPTPVKKFLPFLIQNKRLQSYATIEGIEKAIEIMSNYTSLPAENKFAIQVLRDNYDFLRSHFVTFMSEVSDFAEHFLSGETPLQVHNTKNSLAKKRGFRP